MIRKVITSSVLSLGVAGFSQVAVADGYGFAWANIPSAASAYTPSTTYSMNTKGNISIKRNSVGEYRVTFLGYTAEPGIGGHFQVTAYGSNDHSCQIRSWSRSSAGLIGTVLCFNQQGQKADNRFTVHAVLPKKLNKSLAYAWASKPTTASYNASSYYAHNPGDGATKIKRTAKGRYQVTFTGLKPKIYKGGNVQVTAYGSSYGRCKVVSWGGVGNDLRVSVACFDRNGRPKDQLFNVLVNSRGYYPFFMSYAWASKPTTANYEASSHYSSAGTKISRTSEGTYKVKFPKVGKYQSSSYATHVQVTAYGSGNASCKVISWKRATPGSATDSMDVNVVCHAPDGDKIDSRFTVLTLYPYVII